MWILRVSLFMSLWPPGLIVSQEWVTDTNDLRNIHSAKNIKSDFGYFGASVAERGRLMSRLCGATLWLQKRKWCKRSFPCISLYISISNQNKVILTGIYSGFHPAILMQNRTVTEYFLSIVSPALCADQFNPNWHSHTRCWQHPCICKHRRK